MDVEHLIRALSRPSAYPHERMDFEVHQTHISVVFLAGPWAYKVKKPVNLGFLDFTDPADREHYCHEEVRLNARRAPGVYRGVVPVTAGRWRVPEEAGASHLDGDGEMGGDLRFGGPGDPVEWAVKMERLPPDATLLRRLERDDLTREDLERVGSRVASFHTEATGGEEVARYGAVPVVAGNARENLEQTRDHVGPIVAEEVHRRVEELLEVRIGELESLIARRAREGRPRETHGDLHLDHIYLFRDREPPRDLLAVDCIEFNERFRFADPVADMAFLAMDLRFRGRPDLEEAFSEAYFRASGDDEGRTLLGFYRSYRAAVRAKVGALKALSEEVPEDEREPAARDAEAHWLLALAELADPAERPALVLVGGLPGVGKTTVARELARRAGFQVVSTDRVRKELAGVAPEEDLGGEFEEGVYAPEWTERTYATCRERTREILRQGGRVLVDGSFRSEEERRRFLDTARSLALPALLVTLQLPEEEARRRLRLREGAGREAAGGSDADGRIHQEVRRRWEVPGPGTRRFAVGVDASGTVDDTVVGVLGHLRRRGLVAGGE